MTATLHPYPAYKPSCVPQLGDVPVHWDVRRLKDVGHLKAGAGFPHQYQGDVSHELPFFKVGDMGVSANARVMKEWQHTISAKAAKELGAHVFPSSTIVFAKVGAALLLNRRRMLVNPSCIDNNMMGFMPGGVDPDWMLYWLGTLDLGTIVNPGAVPSVNEGQMRVQTALVPPLPEQSAIVRYLDYVDRRIRRYVAAKRKLIAVLEEEKQAIINQAVTRGLDPNVRLKPSGVEWLGDVPEHWEMQRLKQISVIQTGITLGKNYGDEELIESPYLRVANVQSGRLDLSRVTTVRVPPAEIRRATLKTGDVLMTEGGDIDKLGRGCIWLGDISGCLHQNHIFAVRPKLTVLNPAFLVAVMGSRHGRIYFEVTAKRTTNLATTNLTTLGNCPMYVPRVSEQQAILDHIAEQCGLKDTIIAQAHRQIELLREYRTRLISDAVTGKLDVRDVAAQLPDEADDQDPIEESGPLTDGIDKDLYPDESVEELAMESEVTV